MLDRNDARITAYAMGELDEAGRAEVERAIAADPSLADEIGAIRDMGTLLQQGLNAEPVLPVIARSSPRRRVFGIAAVAAACLAIGFGGGMLARQGIGGQDIATNAPQLGFVVPTTQPLNATELRKVARAFAEMGRYGEAIVVVDQILAIDPTDEYATGVRPLLMDRLHNERQKQIRDEWYTSLAKQLIESEQKNVPYADILNYPQDWPTLATARAPQANAPAAPARLYQYNAVENGSTVVFGGATASDPAEQFRSAVTLNGPVPTTPAQPVITGVRRAAGEVPQLARERGLALKADLADVDVDGIADAPALIQRQFDAPEPPSTELYDRVIDNPFLTVSANPLSTFSVDVDTASYSNIRRMLRAGQLPPADAVRIEEMINYFHYDDAPPKDGKPFATHIEVASAPWAPSNRLVRVALKGQIIQNEQRPPSNLVFLIDVSGSMNQPNKLPLLKDSLAKLVGELRDTDTVSIVVYAGNSGLVLPATPASDKATIYSALDKLEAGGSTNGGQGIALAYDTAQQQFIKDGTNRVILCTDGDFNVGITDRAELLKLVEDRAKGGVYLTILGFGMGNYKDATMEELSNKGNGNYAYIDTHREAEKVFIEQLSGTLVTIAKDVKLQIEFNPSKVASYRLIGYENRILAAEDFNDDRKDAGDIGAGHSVVALYEIVPAEQVSAGDAMAVDPLRYQTPATRVEDAKIASELLTVKLRYKSPDSPAEPGTSQLIETPVVDTGKSFEQTSEAFRWTTAVAAAGMTLRNSPHRGTASLEMALQIADKAMTVDPGHHRQEFVSLLKTAQALSGNPQK